MGRAEGIADCTAEEAAAWMFEYCGRERMREHLHEGHPSRLEKRKKNPRANEKFFSTVKRMGRMSLMLKNREFVIKQMWRRNENGSMSVAFESVDDVIDYGGKVSLVRGVTCGFLNATNVDSIGGVPQCKLEFMQYMDGAGFIPVTIIHR